ncbi:10539_t:CDS:2 [Ambispora leptoticha]|uniref:3-hydroxyisobutyryl-CoA hydrolase n=1 Tax=Ambispora leptoticha TaxID=144679 RepID=A0A9N8ZPK2_9GLOM|nr:10539_t:CDS:2 [Ambispora leptoticha]
MNRASSLASQLAVVIHRRKFGGRFTILNRPEKYNALNLEMIRSITPQLQAWNESNLCKVIILKATGSKAFCAGGDVRAATFFEEEYQLNHLLATLDKPFVALMNGITMGGGVGLSVHAPFRVATENTVFAMPETHIGFFPDVGGSFFLPRMDGETGTYLALTGTRLKGIDVFLSGVATHYIPSERLPYLEERLCELESDDHEVINAAIEDYVAEPDNETRYSLSGDIRNSIDRLNTVEEIVAVLEKENTPWAKETRDIILKMSPTSLKVTLHLMRVGKNLGIADCFNLEYRLAQKFLEKSDFAEGVTARLIEKRDSPNWNPQTLEQISDEEIENFYFKSPAHSNTLNLLNPRTFISYPHARLGLPTESDIKKVVTGQNRDVGPMAMTKREIVDFFLKERKGKIGTREKVMEVLDRKTRSADDGNDCVRWVNNDDFDNHTVQRIENGKSFHAVNNINLKKCASVPSGSGIIFSDNPEMKVPPLVVPLIFTLLISPLVNECTLSYFMIGSLAWKIRKLATSTPLIPD